MIGIIPQTSLVVLPKRNPYLFSLRPSHQKGDKSKYYIAGVVLSLNEGQSFGLNSSANILPQVQNSLSEIRPAIQSGEHIIRIREMKMFEREDLWLSDEIMERA